MSEDWASQGARLTAEAIKTTIRFLPTAQYELRLIPEDRENGPIITRHYTRDQLLKSVKFLRVMNRKGYHVYFRPEASHLIFVDDLSEDGIDAMMEDEIRPVLVYETSKGLHHAWVQLANRPEQVTEDEATAARKIMAKRYGGDRRATGTNQLGRLPGFRNVKQKHEDANGGHPLVIIKRACFVPVASELLNEAKMRASDPEPFPLAPMGPVPSTCQHTYNIDPHRSPLTPVEARQIYHAEYDIQANRLGIKLTTGKIDRSRMDFNVAKGLVNKYGYDPNDLAAVLLYGSEKAAERGMDYLRRTVEAALR